MGKHLNKTQQHVIDVLKANDVKLKRVIMLTKTQYDDYYTVSVDYMSVGVHIPENEIDTDELVENNENSNYTFILNKVWVKND